jgi:hypothetical protein
MKLHGRQFVIGPAVLEPDRTWRHSALSPDLVLSHCETLPVRSDHSALELGIRVGRGGRFVTIKDDVLTLDPTGTLGCFFRSVDGKVWASSSPSLLRTIEPVLPLPPPEERPKWRSEREWFPPPHAGIRGISRLLPSQRLNLVTADLTPRRLLPSIPSITYNEALDAIEQILRETIRALASSFEQLWLPLTSGGDSRLLLAACAAEGVEAVSFTFDREPSKMDDGDRILPAKLAASAGFEHRLIPMQAYDANAVAIFDEHTAFHSDDMDRVFVGFRQWELVPREALVLGGNVLELGRCYYRTHQPAAPQEWFEWLEQAPSELDWRDRLYLEQRIAGWLSSFEQGVDATRRQRVQVANNGDLLALLLSLPEGLRRDGVHQRDLTRRLHPPLAQFPVNPVFGLHSRVQARVARERSLLLYHGGVRAYVRSRASRIRRQLRSSR